MTTDPSEKIGEWADTVEALLCAMKLPMPAQAHLDALRESLTSMLHEMRAAYTEATGENPWEDY